MTICDCLHSIPILSLYTRLPNFAIQRIMIALLPTSKIIGAVIEAFEQSSDRALNFPM